MKMPDSMFQLPPIDVAIAPISRRLCQAVSRFFSRGHTPDPYEEETDRLHSEQRKNSDIEQCLKIPIRESTPEYDERLACQAKGRFLARQEDWDILATLISDADQSRAKTTNGVPVADLLAYGARADVVLAAEHALFDGRPANGAQLLAGIDALEQVLAQHPDSYPVAMIVALAHMDVGLAWRGNGWLSVLNSQNKDAFSAHFARAIGILNQFDPTEHSAPSLAAARCALLAEGPEPRRRIADQFEKLIDLDPANSGYMRAMGTHLLPQRRDPSTLLELEARRTASRTQEIWGVGAYSWVCFDAILMDDNACAQIETSFFIEGLRDILARSPDQHTANLLAAYCAVSIRAGIGSDDAADLVRHQLMDCAGWIIRDHLTEIHPLVWAQAAGRFDTSARTQSVQKLADRGRRDAVDAISALFGDDFAQGRNIAFAPPGPLINAR